MIRNFMRYLGRAKWKPYGQCILLPSTSRLMSTQLETTNLYTVRSHNCGQLTAKNIGERVELYGWLAYNRSNRFLVVRDLYGLVQAIVVDKNISQIIKERFTIESVIKVKGVVQARPEKDINKNLQTGEIEVLVSDIELLNGANKDIKFHPSSVKDNIVDEQMRMEYRYLDIRRQIMQNRLILRSKVISRMRKCLIDELGFFEIETPTLFVETPGGAAEFPVPCSKPPLGRFYSLVQSPQQFKQLLMVGGMDKYFQVARCYRDEKTSRNRQPEFTQLDIELSFTSQEKIRRLVEKIIEQSWPYESVPEFPFEEMKYSEAMRSYGSDKPDLRFDWKLTDVTHCLTGKDIKEGPFQNFEPSHSLLVIKVPIELNKIEANTLQSLEILLQDHSFYCPFSTSNILENGSLSGKMAEYLPIDVQSKLTHTLNATRDNVLVFCWGRTSDAQQSLGYLRQSLANSLDKMGFQVFQDPFKFLWVVDFPLFVLNEENGFEPTRANPHGKGEEDQTVEEEGTQRLSLYH